MPPKAPLLSAEDYQLLRELLLQTGYTPISKKHKAKEMERLALVAPRRLEGSEEGWRYSSNGYTAVLWTSFLPTKQKFRDVGTDIGWVIITQGDEIAYSATPIPRRKDFVLRMARKAWVTKWKIDNIPLCPCCNARMAIYRRPMTRQYLFVCKKSEQHHDGVFRFRSWDYELPRNAQAFIDLEPSIREAYRDKDAARCIIRTPKAAIRKKWEVGKTENIIKHS